MSCNQNMGVFLPGELHRTSSADLELVLTGVAIRTGVSPNWRCRHARTQVDRPIEVCSMNNYNQRNKSQIATW